MSIASISSISGISATARVSTPMADSFGAGTDPRPNTPTATASPGRSGLEAPTPPRFPWLSRLSDQLNSASGNKPAFTSAPILGDIVDKSA